MYRIAIGSMIHNEAGNLPRLLPRLASLSAPDCEVAEIIVVCSGCTDGSELAVSTAQRSHPRLRLIHEATRMGKATAINQFLGALGRDSDLCVLVSGDVLPAADALEALADDSARRIELGTTGRQKVHELFGPARMAGQSIDLFTRMIQAHR